jgi:hypothetical protein
MRGDVPPPFGILGIPWGYISGVMLLGDRGPRGNLEPIRCAARLVLTGGRRARLCATRHHSILSADCVPLGTSVSLGEIRSAMVRMMSVSLSRVKRKGDHQAETTFTSCERAKKTPICVSCGSGWSVPCVSIQLTLSMYLSQKRRNWTTERASSVPVKRHRGSRDTHGHRTGTSYSKGSCKVCDSERAPVTVPYCTAVYR